MADQAESSMRASSSDYALVLPGGLQDVEQSERAHRLYQMQLATGGARPAAVFIFLVGRNRDDADPREARLVLNALAYFVAIHPRQAQVEQHEVRCESPRSLQRRVAIDGELNAMAYVLDELREDLHGIEIVFNDKYAPRLGSVPDSVRGRCEGSPIR